MFSPNTFKQQVTDFLYERKSNMSMSNNVNFNESVFSIYKSIWEIVTYTNHKLLTKGDVTQN